jgi:hypothetical protein
MCLDLVLTVLKEPERIGGDQGALQAGARGARCLRNPRIYEGTRCIQSIIPLAFIVYRYFSYGVNPFLTRYMARTCSSSAK